jgi:23S rRNA pseudouridine2604 synthase
MEEEETRLNKFISETGLCSRREADRLIEQRRVKVNGKIAEVGTRVTSKDRVEVDKKVIQGADKKEPAIFVAYNKPVGIETVTDPSIPNNIVDAVRHPKRIFPIGRLDVPSEGLIFLTNDGDSVNKILRAGNAHEKEYEVTVDKPITVDFIERMANGLPILGTVTQKCKVDKVDQYTFRIVLTQGLNRQIRRMCEFLEYEVTKLKRTRIMNIDLAGLSTGDWRELEPEEVAAIQQLVASSSKTEDASIGAGAGKRRESGRKPPPPRKKGPAGRERGGRHGGRHGGRR